MAKTAYSPAMIEAARKMRLAANRDRRAQLRMAGICTECETDDVGMRADGRPATRCPYCLEIDNARSRAKRLGPSGVCRVRLCPPPAKTLSGERDAAGANLNGPGRMRSKRPC